jgi:hypothetical protein
MNAHLNHILAQQRIAALQRAADHARLATDASTRRRDSRDSNPIVHALPMPTAHPSPEAWPDRQLACRYDADGGPHQGPTGGLPRQYRTQSLDGRLYEGCPGPALPRSGEHGGVRAARERCVPRSSLATGMS